MSKTQDKKAARIAEAAAFVKQRRVNNLEMFEQSFETGLRIFEERKESIPPEEVEMLEKQKEETIKLIADMKAELGIEEVSHVEVADV